jgi:hypothetical protein
MANVDRPAGLKPVGHLNGNPWNGKANMYYIPSTDDTDTFIGDAVQSAGSADTTGKYPTVAQAAAGGNVRGVVIGFSDQPYISVDTSNLYRKYRPGGTAMYALVVDDPDVIFEIQEDNASDDIYADMIGLNTDLVVGSGDTASGASGMELDSDGTTSGAAQCRILRVSNREDNALGTHCKFDVLLIEHELRSTTGD